MRFTMETKAYMYVVQCADGTLYTGYTTDIERRIKTHNAGKGAKYTRPRLPVTLIYQESFPDKELLCQPRHSLNGRAGRKN